MPCLNISTNVSLESVDTSAVLSETTKAVAKIIGKPESVCGRLPSPIVSDSYFLFLYVFPLIFYPTNNEAECEVLLSGLRLAVEMHYVMVVLKGSIPISFGGTQQAAAYGELVSIGGLNPDANQAQEHAQCLHALHQQ
ncbi:unnamed protein product [Musa textilis]